MHCSISTLNVSSVDVWMCWVVSRVSMGWISDVSDTISASIIMDC
jgi:hypothetical protein